MAPRGGACSGTAPALRGGACSSTAPALRGGAWFVMRGLQVACACGALAACGKSHDLSTDQLSRVIDAHRPELKVCYDAALAKYPLNQDIHMQAILDIAPSGQVKSVELEKGTGLPGMQDCVRAQIVTWQFPPAPDPTATSLPLVFKPEVVNTAPGLKTLEDVLKAAGKTK
jgi:hypothetical protein